MISASSASFKIDDTATTSNAVSDRFTYRNLSDSGTTAATRDLITDFQLFQDVIVMEELESDTVQTGIQHVFTVLGVNKDFTGAAGQVRALHVGNAATGNTTIVQADVNGDQKADFTIELTGLLNLTSSSFDFVL